MILIEAPFCHNITKATDSLNLSNEHWVFSNPVSRSAGLITNYTPQTNYYLNRIDADGADAYSQCWGIRAYDVIDWIIETCHFHDIMALLPDGSKYVGEHGIYVNIAGNLTIKQCTFDNIAGQAIQTVFVGRTNESSDYNKYLHASGTIKVIGCSARNIGAVNPNHKPGGRASFPFSFFPSNQDVHIENCTITNVSGTWWSNNPTDPNAPRYNSYGGIMADGHPKVTIINTKVTLDNPDRELIQIKNVQEFTLTGGEYKSVTGKAVIKLTNVQKINITGVKGNATLYIDGKRIGPITINYFK
jgi:hypothetical protein